MSGIDGSEAAEPRSIDNILRYRRMVLEADKASKDYAGTVNVYGRDGTRLMKVSYSKSTRGSSCLYQKDDINVVDIRENMIQSKVAIYPTYYYDILYLGDLFGSNHKEWLSESVVIDYHYTHYFPKVAFLRAACFGERIDEELARGIVEEAGGEVYSRPLSNKVFMAESKKPVDEHEPLKAEIDKQIVSSEFREGRLNLSALREGDYRFRKTRTGSDRLEWILLKNRFERTVALGDYPVDGENIWHMPMREYITVGETDIGGYLLSFDNRRSSHEVVVESVGWLAGLAMLTVISKTRPDDVKEQFGSALAFKRAIGKKLKEETMAAKSISESGRFRQDWDSYLEDRRVIKRWLWDAVNELYD